MGKKKNNGGILGLLFLGYSFCSSVAVNMHVPDIPLGNFKCWLDSCASFVDIYQVVVQVLDFIGEYYY